MSEQQSIVTRSTWVDHIPVLWSEPEISPSRRQLIILLHPFNGSKETMQPMLEELAGLGFIAVSLDAWQHGERSLKDEEDLFGRVFGNFRRYMWPILGQTTVDTLRVVDWAIHELQVDPYVQIGGLSMGGDIAVAAAGIDSRIHKVAAVVATPDWLRPGMEDIRQPGTPVPAGEPDAYAAYWYNQLNPLTHLPAYNHHPAIHFICGEEDTHVPPDGALRFQAEMADMYQDHRNTVAVTLIPNMGHRESAQYDLWWPECREWLIQSQMPE
ncbi:alpha/beta hydrolase [Paenibacillus shenyangensis]|uniref:alpha/beta hydrolase n=1 Tax=Paenibacillus sp. A9 TaxID=1284352 RepID=UPI00035CA2B0|nr:prolyl oligopeptidase family serine peptidase [Paenibacillus sp. A9]